MSIEELKAQHGESKAQYEEDCKHSVTPWIFWEFLSTNDLWFTCNAIRPFVLGRVFRRKPEAPDWSKKTWSPEGKRLVSGAEFKFYAYYPDQFYPIHGAVWAKDDKWRMASYKEENFELIPPPCPHIATGEHESTTAELIGVDFEEMTATFSIPESFKAYSGKYEIKKVVE